MKKVTCKDLGGPCDFEITGETFEEIGEKSKAHVLDAIQKGDDAHIAAVEAMKELSPEEQQKKFAEFQKKFDEAEEV